MKRRLDGFNVKEITLYTESDIAPGSPVTVGENMTAVVPGNNNAFLGICTAKKGNYVSVAVSGMVTAPFTGSDIELGYNYLASDGNGKLKFDLSATIETFVLSIDEKNKLATILL